MKKITGILLSTVMMLSGCTNKVTDYQETKPKVDLKQYFNGKIKAWGLIQNWRGRVVTRFDVDMIGSWDGNTGTLEEDFVYYDGRKQRRIWTIIAKQNNTYEGRAGDIVGTALGSTSGSGVHWIYKMDVPVDNTVYRLTFDDWMWQMNDGVLINRSYLKKFGITVAELTLFMQKQD